MIRPLAALAALAVAVLAAPAAADEAKHQQLLDKPAPPLEIDFAVNGEPTALARLKGKVVVLCFWGAWSAPSRTTLHYLGDWHARDSVNGLEVIGVSAYTYEVKDKEGYRFDGPTAAVVPIKNPTPETERQLIRDLAQEYRLKNLMVLTPGAGEKAFLDYGVKGLPQFVVIDRKGNVRHVAVGSSDKRLAGVEAAIQKLLKE